eukprot:TRINITY_DN48429_c0_g1_i1.p1 TRINITY_DN48429_c0_g1~~TRINITY_DN48429_c0_g1_i1.p1  ORF type:complete len:598 (-),score=74.44 TRINITY_DN48429_c0_g1_i1:34-1827(-)
MQRGPRCGVTDGGGGVGGGRNHQTLPQYGGYSFPQGLRLLEDLGKHLVMLGEHVEKELHAGASVQKSSNPCEIPGAVFESPRFLRDELGLVSKQMPKTDLREVPWKVAQFFEHAPVENVPSIVVPPPVGIPCDLPESGKNLAGRAESIKPIRRAAVSYSVLPSKSRVSQMGRLIQGLQARACADSSYKGAGESTNLRGKISGLLSHTMFESALGVVVIANSFLLGLQVDESIKDQKPTFFYRAVDVVCSVIFFVELWARFYCERLWFVRWKNPNFAWNILDLFVIVTSFVEETIQLIGVAKTGVVNAAVLRPLRVLRLVRLLRTVKLLRYFRDLRAMIYGISSSMRPLAFAVGLLSMIMYLTAVLIVDTLASSGTAKESNMTMKFGGVITTLYTLFLSVLGGIDWGEAADPLFAIHPMLGLAYSMYVSFSILCVLNVVTGVFVENANRTAAKTDEEVLVERVELRRGYLEEATALIRSLSQDPFIREKHFTDLLGVIEFQTILHKLDVQLDPHNASNLFRMIDFDGTGLMDADELMSRIDQLHGDARSIDIMRLLHTSKSLHKKVDQLHKQSVEMTCVQGLGADVSSPRLAWDDELV